MSLKSNMNGNYVVHDDVDNANLTGNTTSRRANVRFQDKNDDEIVEMNGKLLVYQ